MDTNMCADSIAKANTLKELGNSYYQDHQYHEAIIYFTQALTFDSENMLLYSNRSASYMADGQISLALYDAKKCIELKPKWNKDYQQLLFDYLKKQKNGN